MLARVVCGVLFVCISEYLSGSEAWVAWAYPSVLGTVALVFLLASRKKRKLSVLESLNKTGIKNAR